MADRTYLFITGTSRAGTTAMADLMRSHEQIAMGRERYNSRYLADRHFPPELFEKERFCVGFDPEDSHHNRMQPYYAELLPRFDSCLVVGDKIPSLSGDYTVLLEHFKLPKVVYMARDIFEVASSFEVKRQAHLDDPANRKWNERRDYRAAVKEWNRALENTLEYRDDVDLFVAPYVELFQHDAFLTSLCAFAGVPVSDSMREHYAKGCRKRKRLERKRELALTDEMRAYIEEHARFDLFDQVMELARCGAERPHA